MRTRSSKTPSACCVFFSLNVSIIVFRKSTPPQNRQLIVFIINSEQEDPLGVVPLFSLSETGLGIYKTVKSRLLSYKAVTSRLCPHKTVKSRFWPYKTVKPRFWPYKTVKSRFWQHKTSKSIIWPYKTVKSRFCPESLHPAPCCVESDAGDSRMQGNFV